VAKLLPYPRSDRPKQRRAKRIVVLDVVATVVRTIRQAIRQRTVRVVEPPKRSHRKSDPTNGTVTHNRTACNLFSVIFHRTDQFAINGNCLVFLTLYDKNTKVGIKTQAQNIMYYLELPPPRPWRGTNSVLVIHYNKHTRLPPSPCGTRSPMGGEFPIFPAPNGNSAPTGKWHEVPKGVFRYVHFYELLEQNIVPEVQLNKHTRLPPSPCGTRSPMGGEFPPRGYAAPPKGGSSCVLRTTRKRPFRHAVSDPS